MHADDGGRLLARGDERVPLAGVDRRQPEVRRDLAEAHRVRTPVRVAAHLGGGQLGVPQRDDRQREQLPVGVAAPLLDHPVVVGVDARLAELAVLGLGEGLAAEPRERREAERRLHVVHLHVLDARLRLVAARPHLVVGDRRHRHVVAVEAHRRDVALVDVDEVLVDPAVGLRALGIEGLLVLAAADVLHLADAAALDPGAAVAEALGQPRAPTRAAVRPRGRRR